MRLVPFQLFRTNNDAMQRSIELPTHHRVVSPISWNGTSAVATEGATCVRPGQNYRTLSVLAGSGKPPEKVADGAACPGDTRAGGLAGRDMGCRYSAEISCTVWRAGIVHRGASKPAPEGQRRIAPRPGTDLGPTAAGRRPPSVHHRFPLGGRSGFPVGRAVFLILQRIEGRGQQHDNL